jgi:hypothetical protein
MEKLLSYVNSSRGRLLKMSDEDFDQEAERILTEAELIIRTADFGGKGGKNNIDGINLFLGNLRKELNTILQERGRGSIETSLRQTNIAKIVAGISSKMDELILKSPPVLKFPPKKRKPLDSD